MARPGEWSEEQDEILRKVISEGGSSGDASDRIAGKSRNACIGRAERLGLQFRAGNSSQAARAVRDAQRRNNRPPRKPVEDAATPAPAPTTGKYKSTAPVTLAGGYRFVDGELLRPGQEPEGTEEE